MSKLKSVLVTGANGQLGTELKHISRSKVRLNFIFTDKEELDISNKTEVDDFFSQNEIDYCINCAAHTAVDKAEEEEKLAHMLNVTATKNLAESCSKYGAYFIHISTDFVFDGYKNTPYSETDTANPISIYGKTKLKGEQEAFSSNKNTLVIRTSWLYSTYGNNFVKTMLKLAESKNELNVICDQIGTPTYANDLVNGIIVIIESGQFVSGLYHYSNEGVASWYDFAKAIFEIRGITIKVNPILTEQYPTPAKRPQFSVMSKEKIIKNYHIDNPYWRDSLKECLIKLDH